jgi:hypothetical protein
MKAASSLQKKSSFTLNVTCFPNIKQFFGRANFVFSFSVDGDDC